jgi:2-keto-4-pentenoate hydratase/2-oxohepta-3-ene-1,7-dioic acid hydratase in catechol pathway
MNLVSFRRAGRVSFGRMDVGCIADLKVHMPAFGGLRDFLDNGSAQDWETARDAVGVLNAQDVTLLPPIVDSRKIFGVGVNFSSHAEETGRAIGNEPILFLRVADSQVGAGEALRVPPGCERYECEGELAVVIGRRAWHVAAADALDHVAGYACFLDGTARDWQARTNATTGKNFFRSGSFGPWLRTADEVDPSDLLVETFVNDKAVQRGRTSEMVFPVPNLIAYISRFTPLLPGDVIVTGTPGRSDRDACLALRAGDTVRVEIEGIGALCNTVAGDA